MKYNKFIDHTLLKADASYNDIDKLCQEAKDYDFKSVCVNPCFISRCLSNLKGSDVLVCTVIGFPLGAMQTSAKVAETREAIFEGADEIDMVINVSKLKEKDDEYVLNEIERIKKVCGEHTLKVILETCYLTDEEIVRACNLAKQAGANFVKTSTGFGSGGATAHAVKLMRDTVGQELGVKASGGVRTRETMIEMVEAGASRIGTSNGPKLMQE